MPPVHSKAAVRNKPVDSKIIPGFEDYVATRDAKIYSTFTGQFMTQTLNKRGYFTVSVTKNGKLYCRSVHRLVALAFLDNPGNLPMVNHIDGVTTHNHVTNLEWCTAVRNTQHARETGLYTPYTRAVCIIDENHNVLKTYDSAVEAEKDTGIEYSCIINACSGARYSGGDKLWRYKEEVSKVRERKPNKRRGRSVQKLDKVTGALIDTFATIKDAQASLGKPYAAIGAACETDDICQGFKWRYTPTKDLIVPKPEEEWHSWKRIDDYPSYRISRDGRVYSEKTRRFRKLTLTGGYHYITIDGKHFSIHRLVALAYIPLDPTRPIVNHKNGNTQDNRVENLEWATYPENANHALATGLNKKSQKSVNQIDIKTGKVVAKFISIVAASAAMNLHRKKIARACKKDLKDSDVAGFYWCYAAK